MRLHYHKISFVKRSQDLTDTVFRYTLSPFDIPEKEDVQRRPKSWLLIQTKEALAAVHRILMKPDCARVSCITHVAKYKQKLDKYFHPTCLIMPTHVTSILATHFSFSSIQQRTL